MKHLQIALAEYGQKEVEGDKHNPRIVKYSQDIGNTWVKTDEVAWCSEFVNWVLLQAGIKGTKSAVARSFLKWGEETKTPETGDLVIFWREPKGSNNGHIGFYINETPTTIRVLGGNQNNEVNIKEYKKSQVLSYRKVPTSNSLSSLDAPIVKGMKGDNVKLVQKVLTGLTVDGDFGPKTEAAVKKYQLAKGLVVDGTITLRELL